MLNDLPPGGVLPQLSDEVEKKMSSSLSVVTFPMLTSAKVAEPDTGKLPVSDVKVPVAVVGRCSEHRG